MLRSIAVTLTAALCGASAVADDLIATAAFSNELYRVDSATGKSTLIGAYKLTSSAEFNIPVLARGTNGVLYGVSSSASTSVVYSLDEQTAVATGLYKIPTGPVTPAGAAIDPTSNELYFTNTFGFVPWPVLHRMDLTTGNVTVLGNIGPTTSDVQLGLAFMPDGTLYALNSSQKALWRVDKKDPLNGSKMVGPLGGGADLAKGGTIFFDSSLQSLVAYTAVGSGNLYQVDSTTGAATLIASVPGIAPTMSDFAGSGCGGSATQYGKGCPGSLGFVPDLSMGGCPEVGGQVTLGISGGFGGSTAVLFFGLNQAALPVGFGCNLLISPVLPAVVNLPLGGVGPGAGNVVIPAVIPATLSGVTFTMQTFVVDGGVPLGASASNGLEVSIP